jgi:hypothetical protein
MMPAVRSYRVTETREVVVTGISPAEAAMNADKVFRGLDENPKTDGQGRPMTGPVRVTDISVSEN